MPNYIKNRIELSGSPEEVAAILDKFGTHFERTPALAVDGQLIYIHKQTGEPGWLDKPKGVFRRRGQSDVYDVPDCFEQSYEEAWTRFPDFNKVVPMPKSLEVSSNSLGEMAHELLFGTKMKKFFQLSFAENQRRFRELNIAQQKEAVDLAIQYQSNLELYGATTWYDWSIENWGTKWNSTECLKFAENTYDFITAWSGVPELILKMSESFSDVTILYKYSDEDTGHNCGIGEFKNGETDFRQLEGGSREAYELAFELRPDRAENYQLVGDKYEYVESED
jgi:hypothetical protein